MDQYKKITMPRNLWDRISAMMDREGMPMNFSEYMRHIALNAVKESEARADAKQSKEGNAE